MNALEGVVMELRDAAFPLVNEIVPTSDPDEAFAGANWCLLVGSVPPQGRYGTQGPAGYQRQGVHRPGQAIARSAAKDVRVLVVGNPAIRMPLLPCTMRAAFPPTAFLP